MRFKSGSALSLWAAKLFCLLIQEAGVGVIEPRQHSLVDKHPAVKMCVIYVLNSVKRLKSSIITLIPNTFSS